MKGWSLFILFFLSFSDWGSIRSVLLFGSVRWVVMEIFLRRRVFVFVFFVSFSIGRWKRESVEWFLWVREESVVGEGGACERRGSRGYRLLSVGGVIRDCLFYFSFFLFSFFFPPFFIFPFFIFHSLASCWSQLSHSTTRNSKL